ncbi:MAG: hypothetical protein ACTSYB_08220 [Candidatus Helarchaeota archaeon]
MNGYLSSNQNYKIFDIINDSPEEFVIEFNYRENRWFLVIFIIVFFAIYFVMFFYLGDFFIQNHFYFQNLKLLYDIIISVVFIPLIGLCSFFLIRSIFLKKILFIDKIRNILKIRKTFGVFKTEEEISNNLISDIYVKRNIIKDTLGIRRPSHYSLILEFSNGETIKIFTSFNLYELKLVEKLLIKNIAL